MDASVHDKFACPECNEHAATFSPILKGFICPKGHHFSVPGWPRSQPPTLTIENTPLVQERRYLPTLADLIDRLTIVLQKQIFIHERKDEYELEMEDLLHDIDNVIEGLARQGNFIAAKEIKAIAIIQLSNRFVWENESTIRNGDSKESSEVQLKRLKATHSINGVRNTAKNVLSECVGGRKDYKVDCFAADLIDEFGNWNVFGKTSE